MTSWKSIQIVGQPIYVSIANAKVSWQRTPQIIAATGFGFGEGGFGEGGFGGGQSQSGTPQPVWTPWTVD